MHGPVYEFFKDQGGLVGSLVAGVLALIAAVIGGGFVYWAGKLQVGALQQQLKHMQDAALEHDRRARLDLLNILNTQAEEMARLATTRKDEAELLYSPQHVAVPSGWATAFMMVGPDIEAPGFATLVPGEIRLAATELRCQRSMSHWIAIAERPAFVPAEETHFGDEHCPIGTTPPCRANAERAQSAPRGRAPALRRRPSGLS